MGQLRIAPRQTGTAFLSRRRAGAVLQQTSGTSPFQSTQPGTDSISMLATLEAALFYQYHLPASHKASPVVLTSKHVL